MAELSGCRCGVSKRGRGLDGDLIHLFAAICDAARPDRA